jgi:hypothetical protein
MGEAMDLKRTSAVEPDGEVDVIHVRDTKWPLLPLRLTLAPESARSVHTITKATRQQEAYLSEASSLACARPCKQLWCSDGGRVCSE